MALRIKLLIFTCALSGSFSAHSQTRAQSADSEKFTVVIDPGHGGKAGGTSGTGRYRNTEKDIVLNVALYLKQLIEDKASGISPILTRTKDVDLGLNERSVIANKAKADLFVSIHCNSLANVKRDGGRIWGAETYVMSLSKLDVNKSVAKTENADILLEDNYKEVYKGFDPNDPSSMIRIDLQQSKHLMGSIEFAKMAQYHLGTTAERRNIGVKQDVFWVICHNTMPSVLVEIGFLSNPAEEDFLHSDRGQKLVAQSLFDAISAYKARFFDPMNGGEASTGGIDMEKIIAAQLGNEAPATQTTDNSDPSAQADGISYCVQLTASPSPLNVRTNTLLKKFTDIEFFQEKGMYKYTTARTASYAQAGKDLAEAKTKGARDAFIIAFDTERKIGVTQARAQDKE